MTATRTDITIAAFHGKAPRIHSSAFIAPGCRIVGDVEIGPDVSIWYNCVIRADVNRVVIGAGSNIQDGSVVHCDSPKPHRPEGYATIIGEDVLIGHMAMMGEDLATELTTHRARIAHVQIADAPGRHEPGTGRIDFSAAFAALDASGYAGLIGCEYLPAARTEVGLGWMSAYR